MADFTFSTDATTFMTKRCMMCGDTHRIFMTEGDFIAWKVDHRRIQDVFPHVSSDLREVALSGTCPECFQRMCDAFPEDDYEDADDLDDADDASPFG